MLTVFSGMVGVLRSSWRCLRDVQRMAAVGRVVVKWLCIGCAKRYIFATWIKRVKALKRRIGG